MPTRPDPCSAARAPNCPLDSSCPRPKLVLSHQFQFRPQATMSSRTRPPFCGGRCEGPAFLFFSFLFFSLRFFRSAAARRRFATHPIASEPLPRQLPIQRYLHALPLAPQQNSKEPLFGAPV